jgi:uncharacterized protein YdhG (YjbR/CyaY superfamily)
MLTKYKYKNIINNFASQKTKKNGFKYKKVIINLNIKKNVSL